MTFTSKRDAVVTYERSLRVPGAKRAHGDQAVAYLWEHGVITTKERRELRAALRGAVPVR